MAWVLNYKFLYLFVKVIIFPLIWRRCIQLVSEPVPRCCMNVTLSVSHVKNFWMFPAQAFQFFNFQRIIIYLCDYFLSLQHHHCSALAQNTWTMVFVLYHSVTWNKCTKLQWCWSVMWYIKSCYCLMILFTVPRELRHHHLSVTTYAWSSWLCFTAKPLSPELHLGVA